MMYQIDMSMILNIVDCTLIFRLRRMTATEQHATGLFLHQNGRQSPTTASCISANVGSITDFLFSAAHSTVSTSINIPPSENNDEIRANTVSSSTVIPSTSLPEIVVHHSSEMTLDPLTSSVNSNGTMVSS